MQFKREVGLLTLAIALFAVGTFFYTYQPSSIEATSVVNQSIIYPYKGLALSFVGIGFISMIIASISYTKKTKNLLS